MSDVVEQAARALRARLAELEKEATKVRAALAALGPVTGGTGKGAHAIRTIHKLKCTHPSCGQTFEANKRTAKLCPECHAKGRSVPKDDGPTVVAAAPIVVKPIKMRPQVLVPGDQLRGGKEYR